LVPNLEKIFKMKIAFWYPTLKRFLKWKLHFGTLKAIYLNSKKSGSIADTSSCNYVSRSSNEDWTTSSCIVNLILWRQNMSRPILFTQRLRPATCNDCRESKFNSLMTTVAPWFQQIILLYDNNNCITWYLMRLRKIKWKYTQDSEK